MTVDQLRAQLQAQPFKPFNICLADGRSIPVSHPVQAQPFKPFNIRLADGRSIPVSHPEYTLISPNGKTAIIYQPNNECNIVDVRLVIDLEVKPGATTQTNNP